MKHLKVNLWSWRRDKYWLENKFPVKKEKFRKKRNQKINKKSLKWITKMRRRMKQIGKWTRKWRVLCEIIKNNKFLSSFLFVRFTWLHFLSSLCHLAQANISSSSHYAVSLTSEVFFSLDTTHNQNHKEATTHKL